MANMAIFGHHFCFFNFKSWRNKSGVQILILLVKSGFLAHFWKFKFFSTSVPKWNYRHVFNRPKTLETWFLFNIRANLTLLHVVLRVLSNLVPTGITLTASRGSSAQPNLLTDGHRKNLYCHRAHLLTDGHRNFWCDITGLLKDEKSYEANVDLEGTLREMHPSKWTYGHSRCRGLNQ